MKFRMYAKISLISIFTSCVLLVTGPAWSAVYEPQSDSGPYSVEIADYDWLDSSRNRIVPVRIYYPKNADCPFPVIIMSHGAGGSREGYSYLGKHWASHGYVSVHPEHDGSDDDVWKAHSNVLKAISESVHDPKAILNRPKDISFVIDTLEKMNESDPIFKGKLDLEKIGMAGHSFGSWTTLAVIGQLYVLPSGKEFTFKDSRIKAAIPMSSPSPTDPKKLTKAFSKIDIPVFHMTGTKDNSPIGDTKAEDRRLPFDYTDAHNQYLVTFEDGDHMIFSGRTKRGGQSQKDEMFQDLIKAGSLAFWDSFLKNNEDAENWLSKDGFKSLLGKNGTFEVKF